MSGFNLVSRAGKELIFQIKKKISQARKTNISFYFVCLKFLTWKLSSKLKLFTVSEALLCGDWRGMIRAEEHKSDNTTPCYNWTRTSSPVSRPDTSSQLYHAISPWRVFPRRLAGLVNGNFVTYSQTWNKCSVAASWDFSFIIRGQSLDRYSDGWTWCQHCRNCW